MFKIKNEIMTCIKKFFSRAIYAGIGFLVGCCISNLLTLHQHPVVLTFLAFVVAAGSVVGKVLTKNIK